MINTKKILWIFLFLYPISMIISMFNLPIIIVMIASILSSVITFIVLYLITSYIEIGLKNTIKFLLLSYIISYLFEFIGVHYGIPFGKYYYNKSSLGPLLFGVPIFIPFLWASLGFFSLAASNLFLAILGMVTLDITFDPLLSHNAKLWIWISKGPYYGVPITNFLGWAIVSFLFYSAYMLSKGKVPKKTTYSIAFYAEYLGSWILIDFIHKLWIAGLSGILFGSLFISLSLIKIKYN